MSWLEEYQELMRCSSNLSSFGAVVMLVAVLVEIYRLYSAVASAEQDPAEPEFFWVVTTRPSSLILVGAVFLIRVIIPTAKRRLPYPTLFVSWLFALVTSLWYLCDDVCNRRARSTVRQ